MAGVIHIQVSDTAGVHLTTLMVGDGAIHIAMGPIGDTILITIAGVIHIMDTIITITDHAIQLDLLMHLLDHLTEDHTTREYLVVAAIEDHQRPFLEVLAEITMVELFQVVA